MLEDQLMIQIVSYLWHPKLKPGGNECLDDVFAMVAPNIFFCGKAFLWQCFRADCKVGNHPNPLRLKGVELTCIDSEKCKVSTEIQRTPACWWIDEASPTLWLALRISIQEKSKPEHPCEFYLLEEHLMVCSCPFASFALTFTIFHRLRDPLLRGSFLDWKASAW